MRSRACESLLRCDRAGRAQTVCVVGEPRPDISDNRFGAHLPGIHSRFLCGPALTQFTEPYADKNSPVTGVGRIVFDRNCCSPAWSRGDELSLIHISEPTRL